MDIARWIQRLLCIVLVGCLGMTPACCKPDGKVLTSNSASQGNADE